MMTSRHVVLSAAVAVLFALLSIGMPAARAQDATPVAEEVTPPRPVHIHAGSCEELGDVVQPLTDLTTATGERVGQARRAIAVENSYTSVPMTLDAILGADHAINVHESAENIGVYIACGDLGGSLTADGSLIVGLSEDSDSGFTGVAFLRPGADGASTDVSVFITQAGRLRDRDSAAAQAADGDALVAGEQVPVSLTEFAITMPATLPAGEVTFAITNDGTFTHNFEIENEDLGVEEELETPLEPGETGHADRSISLPAPTRSTARSATTGTRAWSSKSPSPDRTRSKIRRQAPQYRRLTPLFQLLTPDS